MCCEYAETAENAHDFVISDILASDAAGLSLRPCMVTCKIKHFTTFLRPRHSRGKSTALKHFCKCFILHVTTVLHCALYTFTYLLT